MVVRLRCRPVVTASSKAPAMPLRPRLVSAAIISCRCMQAWQAVVAVAVRQRRMPQGQVVRRDDAQRPGRFAPACQDVEDHVVAHGPGSERLARSGLDRLQAVFQHRRQPPHEPAIGLVA